ncbi:hypothetical protein ACFIJ5_14685 [Haloimpatiens sp. FM7330]|uniref:hypothetical protein n=1 Tax=Haloimpatiens sp. FM7330 TaxID=3298610 RepID=UPI003634E9B4
MNTSSSIRKINFEEIDKASYTKACISILKYNFKIIVNLNVLVSIVFIVLAPLIFSLKLLDYNNVARIGEFYLSIIGIILIPYLSNIENRNNIKEVVYSRQVSNVKIVISRIISIMILMFFMILGVMAVAKVQGSSFQILEITFGTWISAAFLGVIGFTAANLSSNVPLGYLISFAYYLMEFMNHGKYTKDLYLFSLTNGSFENGKYLLLFITLVMLVFNLVIIKRKS